MRSYNLPLRLLLVTLLFGAFACGDSEGEETSGNNAANNDTNNASNNNDNNTTQNNASNNATNNDLPPDPIALIQIDVGDHTFDARAIGPPEGELVLLLHGFPQTSYEWHAQLLALGEAGYRAVAPNQRGYSAGARPTEVADYQLDLLVADVLGIADALGAETFHLVGHDWGAVVAWTTADAAPARVETLTTLSIPHPAAFVELLADMESCQYQASSYFDLFTLMGIESSFLANDAANLRAAYEGLSPEAIDDYLEVLGTPEALSAALNWYRANIADRVFLGEPAGTITVPTLFIWSDMDDAVCREGADLTADHVSADYRFEVIEGVGHWIPELAAEEVTGLLLEHLGGAE